MTHSIYALIDPRTGDIRYIGQTIKSLDSRLSKHLTDRRITPKSNQTKESTQKVWDNLSEQERKNRGHRISLGRRYTYATRKGLALEVIS